MLSEPEVLDLWFPNPDIGLSSVENGVLDIADQYAYRRNGEAFVFLQDGYQQFSETVNKLLKATTRAELGDASDEGGTDRDYTGEVPAVVRLNDETYDVSNWKDCIVTVAEVVLSQAESVEPLKQVSGRTRDYVVEEDRRSHQVSPKPIDDSGLYVETHFSAEGAVRVCKKMLEAYDHDLAEFDILTEE
jgi:hypothetical protein